MKSVKSSKSNESMQPVNCNSQGHCCNDPLRGSTYMTTSSLKMHAYDNPLPQDLSQDECCYPQKPHMSAFIISLQGIPQNQRFNLFCRL